MPITERDVVKIAELAHLELTPEETVLFATQLSAIVAYIEKLNELDTSDVPPMMHAGAGEEAGYALRDDEVGLCLGQAVAIRNAPEAKHGQFRVPKVIE